MANESGSSKRKSRLGRGLSSLIVNSAATMSAEGDYVPAPSAGVETKAPIPTDSPIDGRSLRIPVDHIQANPYQPRRDFQPEQLKDLSDSIATQGVLQPLIVCAASDGDGRPYVLIAGERRLRAAKQAGLAEVPCVVRIASRQQMLEWALVENIQRADLNPLERARAYSEYIDRFSLTQAEAAEQLGQSRPTVANYMRMLDLCDIVQQMICDGRLTFGHGKALAGMIGNEPEQKKLARRIVAEGLSVRAVEGLVAALREGVSLDRKDAPQRTAPTRPAYLVDLEEQLTQTTGTRVRIQPGRAKHSGRIVVEYYSLDDFDRIAGNLGLRDKA